MSLGHREKSYAIICHLLLNSCTQIAAASSIVRKFSLALLNSSYVARSKTYSDYKKHNTVKFLIGITPCGSISFLSRCWGGRVSDKNLTQQSGFFEYIEPGDTILADRGFTIADDIAVHGGKLEIPAFTRGKSQLSQREVEVSKQLSMVRIHVERVIGLLKTKYTILKGPLPVEVLKHKGKLILK